MLDRQEVLILKALIRDPRMSDNKVGRLTGVPIRTVSRKRQKMESEGVLKYYVSYCSTHHAKHLYTIKFKLGVTKQKLKMEIMDEPQIKTLFTESIYSSRFAEIDGHTAILMIVKGRTDNEIAESFNGNILPNMVKNHGDCIQEISTIRLSEPIRKFHNYLSFINMENGKIKPDWLLDNIYV
ncbi:AsnC family protein [Candidatus Woesearchaeota archaeon]|nr:AsnC family protein [Candidatus Woesearchaeota archaeon]